MTFIRFDTNDQDALLISRIVDRAVTDGLIDPSSRQAIEMDLRATHLNGNPLDFTALLAAPTFDFGHDLAGISRHLDRTTGQLGDCWLPRYSATPAWEPTLTQQIDAMANGETWDGAALSRALAMLTSLAGRAKDAARATSEALRLGQSRNPHALGDAAVLIAAVEKLYVSGGLAYFKADGMLMNADGTRSTFDDVDQ